MIKLLLFVSSGSGGFFCRRSSKWKHMDTVHAGKKRWACDQCDKAFTVSATLKAHIDRVHINVRDFLQLQKPNLAVDSFGFLCHILCASLCYQG